MNAGSSPPRRIAFGAFPAWEGAIRGRLDARYAPSFVDLADARPEDFDAVIPLAHAHYDALADRPDLLGRKFLHPSPEAVALCRDKLALTRFLIANGLGEFTPLLRATSGRPIPISGNADGAAGAANATSSTVPPPSAPST